MPITEHPSTDQDVRHYRIRLLLTAACFLTCAPSAWPCRACRAGRVEPATVPGADS
jgi:hypothetical protein